LFKPPGKRSGERHFFIACVKLHFGVYFLDDRIVGQLKGEIIMAEKIKVYGTVG
jgi:hypothetical protein